MKARLLLTSLLVGATSLLFAQAGNAEPITIKFAHNSPVRMDAGFHRYFVNFSKLAVKYTDGKVKFQEFPASQMGSDAVAAKKLQLGLIQMMDLASNNLVKFYGGFDLLPFLIPSLKCGVDHVMTDSKLLHDISEGAQKKANIRVLAFETGGQRNMMNSKHAIMSPPRPPGPEDFRLGFRPTVPERRSFGPDPALRACRVLSRLAPSCRTARRAVHDRRRHGTQNQ